MITKQFTINNKIFIVAITEQIIEYINSLKSLYNVSYEDTESFDQTSSEISNIVKNISEMITPIPADNDLDGLIQELITSVDAKTAELNELQTEYNKTKTKRKRTKKQKK
ncbi:MAG: hypothetical protein OXF28_00630 [Thaumarchaeota archaeon]|nr:hypothetical protein [Nitrososphaerota archaeon]MCY3975627.1 hypothetical protein [Nitrososphaerota archaeon]